MRNLIIMIAFGYLFLFGCTSTIEKSKPHQSTSAVQAKIEIESNEPTKSIVEEESLEDTLENDYTLYPIDEEWEAWLNQDPVNDSINYFKQYFLKDTLIQLAEGLEYREWLPRVKSTLTKTYPIVILSIDQDHFSFDMDIKQFYTGKQWTDSMNYTALVNAGMFAYGNLPNGYTVYKEKVIQSNSHKLYNHYLSIDRNGNFQTLDNYCDQVPENPYILTQTIRMYRCDNQVVWGKQPHKQWSTTCIATDKNNEVYFIHSRSGYMVNTLVHFLYEIIPDLKTVSYLEGGPEATLSVKVGDFEKHFTGSYESDFYEADDNVRQWEIPNVIGIRKRNEI